MVDFSKKILRNETKLILDPVEIYYDLDRTTEKSGEIRPAQKEILKKWYTDYREKKDIILKMNTGAGKTLTGLLILESRRRSNQSLEVYLCNDTHLVNQTISQASLFGIDTCQISDENEIPDDATLGRKILVTTIHKLFNGKTIFGLDHNSVKIDGLVLDDAHNSAEIIKESMKMKITKSGSSVLYNDLFSILKESIRTQGEGTYHDILNFNDSHHVLEQFLPVPYWEWQDLISAITSAISKRAQIDNEVKFVWPLLRDILKNCTCLVSPKSIEIVPIKYPIQTFESYHKASQRIFMSATTATDSILIKDLEVDANAVKSPLIYSDEKWSGEKMVIIPSMIEPNIFDRSYVVKLFASIRDWPFGVVALVPGHFRTKDWKQYGAFITTKLNLAEGLSMIKQTPKSFPLVLMNRYDGIDLPDNECRVLILDSLPSALTLYDRYLDKVIGSGSEVKIRKAQKIEQAMGRSVRADTDYSVIILTGTDLVKFIRNDALEYLSLQAKKQIEIGMEFSTDAKEEVKIDGENNNASNVLMSLMKNSFDRNDSWKQYYKEVMSSVDYTYLVPKDLDRIEAEADLLRMGTQYDVNLPEFNRSVIDFTDKFCTNEEEKGWYIQLAASINYENSKMESLRLQREAYKKNRSLLLPWEPESHEKITGIEHQERLEQIKKIIEKSSDYENLWNISEEILSNLKLGVPKDKFELAMDKIGNYLGFITDRPDEFIKEGPDHLWAVNRQTFFAIESKSEVKASRDKIYKSETGQMNNSIAWIEKNYPGVEVFYLMVISTKYLDKGAGFNKPVRIIRERQLRTLSYNFRKFIKSFEKQNFNSVSTGFIQEQLHANMLEVETFIETYSELAK